MRALIKKIRQLLKDKRFRKIWYRSISATAAIVVFVTTYALVLPAITMESEASCGIPAHQHTTDCYEEQLICGLEESDGHHHTDDCYTVTKELTCTTPEHQHDETCFDEDGNLTCSQAEHTHDSTCYEEHRELTCGLDESEGHHHDSSCYKQVLTCGLEAHIHSVECYKEDSKAVTASTSIQASDDFDGAVAATAASTSVPADAYEFENASNGSNSSVAGTTSKMTTDDADQTDAFGATNTSNAFDENSSTAELSSAAATTGVLPEPIEQEDLSEGYVPTLDPVNMDQVLDKHTGFYYYHAGEGEELPASSTEITSWKKVDDNTELAPTDLVKAYFVYTIPAGTLNETNQVARYRLPSNLHLTDDQIMAINQHENGISASYIDYDTLEILDSDNYHKYLGAEAIDGTRTPDQTLVEGTQEYISAVVKAENVYENTLDADGNYITPDGAAADGPGAYIGQDLIFIFTPYTIEKNQITYDAKGNPTAAGEKVSGWFACDFNMEQIDWVEEETSVSAAASESMQTEVIENSTDFDDAAGADDTNDADSATIVNIKKTAEIIFVAEDPSGNKEEISETLTRTEQSKTNPAENPEETDIENSFENPAEEEATEEDASVPAEIDQTTDNENPESEPTAESTEAEAKEATVEHEYKSGTLRATGTDYTITLDYTAEACIPENAELQIREITKESDPEAYEVCLEQAKEQVIDKVTDEGSMVDQKASRFFDIEIVVKMEADSIDGVGDTSHKSNETRKIEPMAPVSVNIQLTNKDKVFHNKLPDSTADENEQEKDRKEPTVLHYADDGVEKIEATTNRSLEEVPVESGAEEDNHDATNIRFEAESFSIYGVVYTSMSTTYITASGKAYEITVNYGAEAQIPEDSELKVQEILPEDKEYQDYYDQSIEKIQGLSSRIVSSTKTDSGSDEEKHAKDVSNDFNIQNKATSSTESMPSDYVRIFDMEIWNDGKKIEPKSKVTVNIKLLDAPSDGKVVPKIVHFAEEGAEVLKTDESSREGGEKDLQFETTSFSVYSVIYTVDFNWEIGGKKYEFNLDGGDSVSFTVLAELLNLASNYNMNVKQEASEIETGTSVKRDETASDKEMQRTAENDQQGDSDNASNDEEVIRIDISEMNQSTVEITEKTRAFISQVDSVEFTNPELLWVEKINEDTTTGDLLVKNSLSPTYPKDLTYDKSCEIYTRKFSAPDWVLIALKPFETEEALTITMKSGDKFTIVVTDDADAILIDDPNGGKKVQTISNPAGTTIDLFDYWIDGSLRNNQGMNGWPGHYGTDAFEGYNDFYHYDYNGNPQNGSIPMHEDSAVSENKWYVDNGHLRGNGNNQGINTGHAFKFFPGLAGTVVDRGDKGPNHTYNGNDPWTNNHDMYSSINSWTGSADPTTGLVMDHLVSGYPKLTNNAGKGTDGQSLSYLFSPTETHSGKEYKGQVNQLLYVDSEGYYTYDSRYYSAKYENDKTFTVKKFADTVATDSKQRGFWPFGDRVNWHGMHMNTKFSMPAEGKVLNPKGEYKDMQFEFSGDDDTWLYIDGILVGDAGGIHNRTEVDINFATGLVTVTGKKDDNHPGTYVWTKYLDDIFRDAGASLDDFEGHTFKAGTYHTFDMFYLERGGSESNLYIHYNLVSTSDFTAHKSYYTQDGNARLNRNQFKFELIGLDGRYEGEPGSRTLVEGHHTEHAIMPKGGTSGGAGTVESPRIENTTTTLSTGTYNSQTFTIGVSEDGNVNFGDAEISQQQMNDCDQGNPATYRYMVREVVPAGAKNADGKTWEEATDEEKFEGGFVDPETNITYDGKVYYFEGTVRKTVNHNAVTGEDYIVYDLKKTRYTDDTYTTIDTETKFFSFVNGFVEKLELKINKKGYSGQNTETTWPLPNAKFKISHAVYDENSRKWVPRPNGVWRERTTDTNGSLVFSGIREGHYILEEEEAPQGYTASGNKWLVTVEKVDTGKRIALIPTFTLLDKNGSVVIDEETSQPITHTYNLDDIDVDQTGVGEDAGQKVEVFEYDILNKKKSHQVVVEKQWLKYNGSAYSPEELTALGDKVNNITITGELWRHVTGTKTTVTETHVSHPTVTVMARLSNGSNYSEKFSGKVEPGSDFSFSMAVNGTGYPVDKKYSTDTGVDPVEIGDQDITYDNGINKPQGHVYKLSNITQSTIIYAVFDHNQANDNGIGYYTVSWTRPTTQEGTTTSTTTETIDRWEQVHAPGTENNSFTLNKDNGWKLTWEDDDLEEESLNYAYELRNVQESGASSNFDFNSTQAKITTVDEETGTVTDTIPLTNKSKSEKIDIPVKKIWKPVPEGNESVVVELHRYAKVSSGAFTVELKTETGNSPIEGAILTLYKKGENGEADQIHSENLRTDENGRVTVTGLGKGTYYFQQVSTPAAYTMRDCVTKTDEWSVSGDVTTPQAHTVSLKNKALTAIGKVVLTLKDAVYNDMIPGAVFELYEGNELLKTNLVTGADGTLEVNNLGAGSYHFAQIGYVDGYKREVEFTPNTFSVDASIVGITQEKSVSATNQKIAKGTLTVNLTRSTGNTAISGAKFELQKDGEKFAEGTTDSDGIIVFTNLGTGIYTLVQKSTAEGLAVAADLEPFTVLDNGRTDQTFQAIVKNEESAGKVTVNIYRAQGSRTGNASQNGGYANPTDTWEHLKPGATITIKVTRAMYNHDMYYCTNYNKNNYYGTWYKITDWNGNECFLSYTVPDSPEEAAYNIGISSGWGIDSGSVAFVGKPADNRNTLLSVPAKASTRRLALNSMKSLEAAGKSITNRSAVIQPIQPPAGYIEDISFDPVELTLVRSKNWEDVFSNQEKYDPEGNLYYYYIVEKSCTDEHYTLAEYGQEGTGTFTVTNTGTTEFEFSKIWKDISDQSVVWPDGMTITVTLNAFTDNNEKALSDLTLTFSPSALPNGWTVTTNDDNKKTTFKTTGLDAATADGDKLTYYVVEAQVNGYKEPVYANSSGGSLININRALNEQQIINSPEDAVELPSTGGSGTHGIYILGSVLVLLAAGMLWRGKMFQSLINRN